MDVNLNKLASLPEEELYDWLEGIPVEQAVDSEYDGDSDADDALPLALDGSSRASTPVRSSRSSSTTPLSFSRAFSQSDMLRTAILNSSPNNVRQSVESLPSCSNKSPDSSVFSSTKRSIRNKNISYAETDPNKDDFDSDDSLADPDYVTEVIIEREISDNESSEVDVQDEHKDEDNEPTFKFAKQSSEPISYKKYLFSEKCGPTFDIDIESPVVIFRALFELHLLEHIVRESNKYAQDKGLNLNLTVRELEAFFGMLIIMGFHTLPSLRLYWSGDQNMKVDRILGVMPQRRFLTILRNLHLNDNSKIPQRDDPDFDKLYKLRPMLNILNNNFKKSYIPDRNLSIDESMVAYKGRSTLKQYMPLKPIKRGFKIWAMSESKTGYLLSFEVYQGKATTEETGTLGERVVYSLAKPYLSKGYCLYFDNFFSTFDLLKNLLEKKTFACGTFRSTRKYFPKHVLANDKLLKNPGDSDYATSDEISVVKWRDRGKKPVVIVSNFHDVSKLTTVKRTNKAGQKENIKCPLPVYDYNASMGGVDRFDQLHACYNIAWKSRRWWIKIFYYLLDAAIVNSYILYSSKLKESKQKPMPQLKFRSILANQLIGTYTNRKRQGPPPAHSILRKKSGRAVNNTENQERFTDVGSHLPIKGTSRRCALCSTKDKPVRSSMICKTCNVGLCLTCFVPYHTP